MGNNNQIALRISGTKERKTGFVPLVMSGVLPRIEETGLYRLCKGCNGLGFVVKHTPTYSFYMAIDGKVRPLDSPASGLLTVAIVIPAGMKFADNKSPYNLLKVLYYLFVGEYMTEGDDGRRVFQNVTADVDPFKSILSQYPLEPTSVSRISMNPAGPTGRINLSPDKMQEFFKDSFYPEFQNFKDIEVGDGLMTSPELSNIKIPRPIKYKIFVNGRQQSEVDSKDVVRRIIIRGDRTDSYYYDDYAFSLGDLIKHRGYINENGVEIRLDSSKERIDCKTQRRYFPYALKVVYGRNNESKTLLTTWLSNGKLRLLTEDTTSYPPAYRDISKGVLKGTQTFEYTELDKLRIKAEPIKIDGYKITVPARGEIDRDKRQVILKIEVKKEVTQEAMASVNPIEKRRVSNISEIESIKLSTQSYRRSDNDDNNNSGSNKMDIRNLKVPLLCAMVVVLLIGCVIGYFVVGYFFPHKSTQEQTAGINRQDEDRLPEEEIIPEAPTDNSVIDETVDSKPGNNGEDIDVTESGITEDIPGNMKEEVKEAAEKVAAANAEKLKRMAIDLYNMGKLDDFGKLCDANPSLRKYREDGIAILKTIFTAKNNIVLEKALIDEGYLNGKNHRGDKSKIKHLDELREMRRKIERLKHECEL